MPHDHVFLTPPDGGSMQAYTSVPDGPGPFPGLIVFQEAFGVNHHIRATADRFAAAGYVAIAPELFHRTAPPGLECGYGDYQAVAEHIKAVSPEGLKADARACFDWLRRHSRVRGGAIASVGYCLGGRASFMANVAVPLKAAVSYYGGGIAPDLVKQASELHAPMLFFWGGLDRHIGPGQVAAVTGGLRAAKKPFVNVEISYADHGFACDERASCHPQATREALSLTMSFLSEKLAEVAV